MWKEKKRVRNDLLFFVLFGILKNKKDNFITKLSFLLNCLILK